MNGDESQNLKSKGNGQKNRDSGLSAFLAKLTDSAGKHFSDALADSRIVRYDALGRIAGTSCLHSLRGNKRVISFIRNFRIYFSSLCEKSFILNFLDFLVIRFISQSSRTFGAFIGAGGAASAVVIAVRTILFNQSLSYSGLILASFFILLSLPLLFSDRSICELLKTSAFFSGILSDTSGLTDEKFRNIKPGKSDTGLAFCIGIITGALSWLWGYSFVPVILLALFLLAFSLIFPEAAYILFCAAAPFLSLTDAPSVTLAVFIGIINLSFIFKLLRGRRAPVSESEFPVFLLLLVSVFLSGLSGFAYSFRSALLTSVLMTGFSLSVNLLRDEKRLDKIAAALVFSSCIISVTGIVQSLLGLSPDGWTDTLTYSFIDSRAVSLFDNPNMLGAYLTAVFPFSLLMAVRGKTSSLKRLGTVSALSCAVCAVLTYSRTCWLGLFAGILIFGFFITPRTVFVIPGAAFTAAGLGLLFPDTVGLRILNFFSLSDSANAYRVKVWKGCAAAFRSCFLTGAGAGDIAFRNIYLNFALPGAESAPNAHSIYLQTGISAGIIPLILFIGLWLILLSKTLRTLNRHSGSTAAYICAASFASVSSMMISGIFDNVFYNYRVMFLYWCIAGMCSAAARVAMSAGITDSNKGTLCSELIIR